MPVKIEFAFTQLVPVPGNIDVNRVDAQRSITIERNFPQISRYAVVDIPRSSGAQSSAAERICEDQFEGFGWSAPVSS